MDASAGRDFTSAVYGSLLVTALLAIEWRQDIPTSLLALSLVTSVAVFWLSHVWSAIVNRRVRGPIVRADVVRVGAFEAPMLAAAVVPALILVLGSIGVFSIDGAITLALAASLIQLFLWGLAVGRAAHTSWRLAIAVAAVDCALGVAIVALKVVAIH